MKLSLTTAWKAPALAKKAAAPGLYPSSSAQKAPAMTKKASVLALFASASVWKVSATALFSLPSNLKSAVRDAFFANGGAQSVD